LLVTKRRLPLRTASGALALAALAACATGGGERYQGIPLAGSAADPELSVLARRASDGDKHAQLALGIRFETGDGVPVDLRRAERLYALAADTSGETRDMYIPPVRPGSTGRVIPHWQRPPRAGLPAAQARLDALRRRREGDAARTGS
jgi:hypothetical protein